MSSRQRLSYTPPPHSLEHEQRVRAMLAELARLGGVTYIVPAGAITRTQAMRG
jgi:hypothetical protein